MSPITTRLATKPDLPEVLLMVQALARHHGDTPQLTLEGLERDVLGHMPWVRLIVAQADGELLGYAALCPLVQLQFGLRGMDMHHLFVQEAARGRGVGRVLIDACIALSRQQGCQFLAVGTHPDNKAAAEVYLNAGFKRRSVQGPRFSMRLT